MNSRDRRPRTFLIHAFGCKVNQYESQVMRESMLRNGFVETDRVDACDFYIINSCTVTRNADRDTRNLARHFNKINPSGKIVVAGCYAELDADRETLSAIPGVYRIVRNSQKPGIGAVLSGEEIKCHLRKTEAGNAGVEKNILTITDFKNRNRAFIKIQDGCNHKCSYCKVSLVRGPSRSRVPSEIFEEADCIIKKGFKEIVLTGICLGAWGMDFKGDRFESGGKMDLADIAEEISEIEGLFRIRLSSIEPIYVTDRLINVIKDNGKLCKHIHIPLQSGDGRILKLMRRPYTTLGFRQLIKKLRREMPDIAFTTDVLVGFPGEDDGSFSNTLKFLREIKPSRMHIFSYSERRGTAASGYYGKVEKGIISKRVKILLDLNKEFSSEYTASFIGKTQSAVIESERDRKGGCLSGYTDRYIRIFTDGSDCFKNMLVPVTITGVDYARNAAFARLDNGGIM
ncbi:MAG: tRNA (N(6)-L-threonylcarbamoyladenosine(37)-C(2))-methylthiotransferase MtaB [Candidatus Omnitrophica bacterium]|nr:tRNA (N(6)-L-threonylcarbamoyladenosine(37)-C(2))-methylthiotransferase MtaB [Candidatus Omnitrophota bacterium]